MSVKKTAVKISVLSMFLLNACSTENAEAPSIAAAGETSPGYIRYLNKDGLDLYKSKMPKIDSAEYDGLVHGDTTIWYNDNPGAMETVYQDSVTTVLGLRHNTVGHDVGIRHKDSVIGKLVNFFQEKGFRFPFFRTAGTDNAVNYKLHTLWLPPRDKDGKALPVLWWMDGNRYRWTFPVGTYFAEILYVKNNADKNGEWFPYEIRTRKRYINGWSINAFRPFPTAESLADAIEAKRPNWQSEPDLAKAVKHLRDSSTLKPVELSAGSYSPWFATVKGSLDDIPALNDPKLVRELLTETTFTSVIGKAWKTDGKLETYAPASSADFSIVPKGYQGGLFPVNEESCSRCHNDTGRYIGELDFDVQLYGEIWGDDWIFSWHPFETVGVSINGTYENNRDIDPRLKSAGLIKNEMPPAKSTVYKPMPRRFTQIFR